MEYSIPLWESLHDSYNYFVQCQSRDFLQIYTVANIFIHLSFQYVGFLLHFKLIYYIWLFY